MSSVVCNERVHSVLSQKYLTFREPGRLVPKNFASYFCDWTLLRPTEEKGVSVSMIGVLLKLLLFISLPALGLWFLFVIVATPLTAFMPVYFKMVMSPIWFVMGFFVALFGWNKKMGFWVYFVISLLLSPLVGFIVVMFSDKKVDGHEPRLK